ncbi:hypothetical protein BDZ91DRAFT_751482 [Kalaharituber pfeilii]|nr:hypothetical protein BDZ91DRAFT_751482 [Kalaharituber pfeilii]
MAIRKAGSEGKGKTEDVRRVVDAVARRKRKGGNAKLMWVKAHIGIAGNEKADERAKKGTMKKKSPGNLPIIIHVLLPHTLLHNIPKPMPKAHNLRMLQRCSSPYRYPHAPCKPSRGVIFHQQLLSRPKCVLVGELVQDLVNHGTAGDIPPHEPEVSDLLNKGKSRQRWWR